MLCTNYLGVGVLFPDQGREKPRPSLWQGQGSVMTLGSGRSGSRGGGASGWVVSLGLELLCGHPLSPPGTRQLWWKRSGLPGSSGVLDSRLCPSFTALFSLALQPLERRGAGSRVLLAPRGSGDGGDCAGRVHAVPRAGQEQMRVTLRPILPMTPASPSPVMPQ